MISKHLARQLACHDAAVEYVAHENPIGRAAQNYMIHADVDGFGVPVREQLWTVQLTEETFEVACLPFFSYGVCFRDVVSLHVGGLLAGVVNKSGHRTLRVSIDRGQTRVDELHELLHGQVVRLGLAHEWFQGTLLAVDLAPGFDPSPLYGALDAFVSSRALYWELDT